MTKIFILVFLLTRRVLVTTIDALGHYFKQDNYSTVGGDGGCRGGEVQAGTTSPMPDHNGFKLQQVSEIHPLHFRKFSTLSVNEHIGQIQPNHTDYTAIDI